MMTFTYDSQASAAYIQLSSEPVARTETVQQDRPLINFDYDAEGNLIGIEVVK